MVDVRAWMVFTDLDGTLLDHHSYGYESTNTVRACLARRSISVHIASSKTFAEGVDFYRQWGVSVPMVVENGAALAVPEAWLLDHPLPAWAQRKPVCVADGFALFALAANYALIREHVVTLRERHAWTIEGFGDWDAQQVAERTGLPLEDAHRAKQRMASEPLLFDGTEGDLAAFSEALAAQGLRLLRGGRFLHVMGAADKASGVQAVLSLYACRGAGALRWLALGDSENDRAMLEQADAAVVVRRVDGEHLRLRRREGVFYSPSVSPNGWVEGLGHFIC